jgi:hypothetical protein
MASDRHHKNRNLNVRAIGIFGIGLILLAGGSILMLSAMFRYFEMRENANQARTTENEPRKVPAEPRLQDHAVQDLQQMRAEEDQILNSYAWVDKKKVIVRIPIERAIDLLVNRGLRGPAKHSTPNSSGNAVSAGAPVASNVHQRMGPVADHLVTTQAKEGYTK